MITSNYHIHSHYCDGHAELDAYVLQSIAREISSIGFSSHAPLPFDTNWTMPLDRLSRYLADIQRCRSQYKRDIAIGAGLEVDYLPGHRGYYRPPLFGATLDYVIGVVHFVGGEGDDSRWTVDGPSEAFEAGLRERYQGDIRNLVCEYFQRTRDLVHQPWVSVLGHFDRMLYQNVGGRLFSESAPWYIEAVEETLQTVAKRDLLMELNTAGWFAPLRRPNPVPQTLKRCRELGIRFTVGTDAHRPENVDRGLDLAEQLLIEMGYREIWTLEGARWVACPIASALQA